MSKLVSTSIEEINEKKVYFKKKVKKADEACMEGGYDLNEIADPDLADAIKMVGGALGTVLAAGGITYLQQYLKNHKNEKVRKFGDAVAQMGKGAAAGARKAPPSTGGN